MFDHNNFGEVNYLNFVPDFKIELDHHMKLILGANGTGKTSLYKNIQKNHPEYYFLDYEEIKNTVKSYKDKIIISSRIQSLEQKINERQIIINESTIASNISELGFTSTQKAKNISNDLENYRKKPDVAIKSYTGNSLVKFSNLSENDKSFIVSFGKKILEIRNIETTIDQAKEEYKRIMLEYVDKCLYEDTTICPICGTNIGGSIKELINSNLAELHELNEEIVKEYKKYNVEISPNELVEHVNNIKNEIDENGIEINDIVEYILCKGEQEKSNTILAKKEELLAIEREIEELENHRDEFYNNLKEEEQKLKSTLINLYSVLEDDIEFDDIKKEIRIKMPRKIETYSTGEINYITFLVSMLQFVSCDKEVIVIDDPLSSYDIPNQYKIMYEIVSLYDNNKKVLLFTHNIDCINIANSQVKGRFKYEILEKINDTIYLNKIDQALNDDGLSVDFLLNNTSDDNEYKKYIKILLKKDQLDHDDPHHELFHYDNIYNYENLSNEDLVTIIESFDSENLQNIDFITNFNLKIILLAAIRVWIEKQLLNNTTLSGEELKGKSFGEKISKVFNNNWTGPENINKKYLMSKKVMINQNEHSNSQKFPFYFALSISLNDMIKEINELKQRFS